MISRTRSGLGRALINLTLGAIVIGFSYPIPSEAGTDIFEYDELGRLKKVTYADGTSTTYTLDPAGNRTALNTGGGSSSSSSGGPTYIAITSSAGAILPSAASLYRVEASCSSGQWHTACTWVVRKLYGGQAAVIAVVHAPAGTNPACNSGTTQQITTGYVRSGCSLSALSTVYGQ